jgi:hypothetical protein
MVLKRAIVPMVPASMPGEPEFEVIVYGRSASELMTVPNETVQALARKYPEHRSSPFLLRDAKLAR